LYLPRSRVLRLCRPVIWLKEAAANVSASVSCVAHSSCRVMPLFPYTSNRFATTSLIPCTLTPRILILRILSIPRSLHNFLDNSTNQWRLFTDGYFFLYFVVKQYTTTVCELNCDGLGNHVTFVPRSDAGTRKRDAIP